VPVTVNDVLDGHVALDPECLDRLYLHGYLGQLQVGGQVIQFLNHRGYPVPSPACLQQIGDAFRRRVASFAEANHIPVVPLKAADRNIEVMRPYLDREDLRRAAARHDQRVLPALAAPAPAPLGPQDSKAGYWWECSMAQVEVSRTIVFDAPRHARGFFDALVTDNPDLGRPDTIEIIFGRQIRNGRQRATQGTFKTKVITRGVDVTVNAFLQAFAHRAVSERWACTADQR